MGVNGLSVQRYGCEGETSWNCLHHARAAASEPYQPPGFLPTCGDPTPRVAFLSVTWVRCAIFLEEIGRHKLFRLISLRKSLATKLFRLISLRKSAATNYFGSFPWGNRPPQNYFGSFPQGIGRHKLFRPISSGNRWMGFHSFPQEIAGMAHIELTLFLRRTHVSVDAHGKAPF